MGLNNNGTNMDLDNVEIDPQHAIDNDANISDNTVECSESECYPRDNLSITNTTDVYTSGHLIRDSDFSELFGIPCLDSVVSVESFHVTEDVYQGAELLESDALYMDNIEDLIFHDGIEIDRDSLIGNFLSSNSKLYDLKPLGAEVHHNDNITQEFSSHQGDSAVDSRGFATLDHSDCNGNRSVGGKDYRCHLCLHSYDTFQDFQLHYQHHYDHNNTTKSRHPIEKPRNIFEIFKEIKISNGYRQQSTNNETLSSETNNNPSSEYSSNQSFERHINQSLDKNNNQPIAYNKILLNNDSTSSPEYQINSETDSQTVHQEQIDRSSEVEMRYSHIPQKTICKRIGRCSSEKAISRNKKSYDIKGVAQKCVAKITTSDFQNNVNHSKPRETKKSVLKKTLRSTSKPASESKKNAGRHLSQDILTASEQSDLQIHFCQMCGKSFNRPDSLKNHLRDHEAREHETHGKNLKTFPCSTSICDSSSKNKHSLKQQSCVDTSPKTYKCDICSKFFRRKKNLLRHFSNHNHKKPDLVGCGVCGKLYNINTLKKHIQAHSDEKRFKCEVCDKSFNEKHVFESHTRMHTGAKPYECHICHKRFASKPVLHMRVHSGEKPYKCDICGKRFNIQKNMRRHLIIHTGLKPYQCEVCEKSFNDPGALKTHKRIHTGETPYACDVCDKVFKASCDLTRHRRVHSGYKPFKCHICGKCFQQKYALRSHLEIHTGYTKDFKCNVCCKSFRTKGSLKSHMNTHIGEKLFQCPKCPKRLRTASSLSLHDRVHSQEKPFSCDVCGRAFSIRSNMTRHIRTHTGEKPYKCLICNKQFTNPNGVLYHEQMHKGDKPHKCDACNKTFQSKGHVQQHMLRNHYGEKRFECNVCDKSFKTNTELKGHSKTHSEEKEYKCDVCSKLFKHRSSVRKHMMSHVGEKPYKCDVCYKKFTTSTETKVHMRCHTDDKRECNICKKLFTYRSGLLRHLKNVHDKSNS